MKSLQILPKIRDSWGYLYVEHSRIDQEDKAIAIHNAEGKVPVPCATLTTLMLGPGTAITHAAIRALADNGCLVLWTGEGGVRFYALGIGETRSSANLLHQAKVWSTPVSRLQVVTRLYQMRFLEPLEPSLTLRQIRGKEGIRVRNTYARASMETGIPWSGRSYRRDSWDTADPINRALSSANSCLYGVCHAAIISAGYSPALGFIHTGKMLSFVYDIADLYKTEVAIPVAFQAVAQGSKDLESRVRRACRDIFHTSRLLERIVPDIQEALGVSSTEKQAPQADFDSDDTSPGGLWDPEVGIVPGGVNRGDEATGGL